MNNLKGSNRETTFSLWASLSKIGKLVNNFFFKHEYEDYQENKEANDELFSQHKLLNKKREKYLSDGNDSVLDNSNLKFAKNDEPSVRNKIKKHRIIRQIINKESDHNEINDQIQKNMKLEYKRQEETGIYESKNDCDTMINEINIKPKNTKNLFKRLDEIKNQIDERFEKRKEKSFINKNNENLTEYPKWILENEKRNKLLSSINEYRNKKKQELDVNIFRKRFDEFQNINLKIKKESINFINSPISINNVQEVNYKLQSQEEIVQVSNFQSIFNSPSENLIENKKDEAQINENFPQDTSIHKNQVLYEEVNPTVEPELKADLVDQTQIHISEVNLPEKGSIQNENFNLMNESIEKEQKIKEKSLFPIEKKETISQETLNNLKSAILMLNNKIKPKEAQDSEVKSDQEIQNDQNSFSLFNNKNIFYDENPVKKQIPDINNQTSNRLEFDNQVSFTNQENKEFLNNINDIKCVSNLQNDISIDSNPQVLKGENNQIKIENNLNLTANLIDEQSMNNSQFTNSFLAINKMDNFVQDIIIPVVDNNSLINKNHQLNQLESVNSIFNGQNNTNPLFNNILETHSTQNNLFNTTHNSNIFNNKNSLFASNPSFVPINSQVEPNPFLNNYNLDKLHTPKKNDHLEITPRKYANKSSAKHNFKFGS